MRLCLLILSIANLACAADAQRFWILPTDAEGPVEGGGGLIVRGHYPDTFHITHATVDGLPCFYQGPDMSEAFFGVPAHPAGLAHVTVYTDDGGEYHFPNAYRYFDPAPNHYPGAAASVPLDGTVTGDTTNAYTDYNSCGGTNNPERTLYYTFTSLESGLMELTLCAESMYGRIKADEYFPNPATPSVCATDDCLGGGGNALDDMAILPMLAGVPQLIQISTLYGSGPLGGPFELTTSFEPEDGGTLDPLPNDEPENAIQLLYGEEYTPGEGIATVSSQPMCEPSATGDGWYFFDSARKDRVTITTCSGLITIYDEDLNWLYCYRASECFPVDYELPAAGRYYIRHNGPVAITAKFARDEIPEFHQSDSNADGSVELTELLRLIQFYNAGALHCSGSTEDGYAVGTGDTESCYRHVADYAVDYWKISLQEVMRVIQIFNAGSYSRCEDGQDGYCI